MTGLFRYAFLKNSRDGSLITLLVSPTVMLVAPMLVVWLFDRSSRFRIPPQAATFLAIYTGALMSALAAFMMFRTEIANHTIGTFVLATRSWKIPLSSTIYGCLIGVGAAVGTATVCAVAFGIVPSDLITFLAQVVTFSLATAAGGAMASVLSQSIAATGWVYAGMLVLFAIFENTRAIPAQRIWICLGIAFVCVSIAALLVERRCAA